MGSSKAWKSEPENLVQTDEECFIKEDEVSLLLKMFQVEKSPEPSGDALALWEDTFWEEERIRGDEMGRMVVPGLGDLQ